MSSTYDNHLNYLFFYLQVCLYSSYHPSAQAWLVKRLNKVGAGVSCHARRWYMALAFPLAHHYRAVLARVS